MDKEQLGNLKLPYPLYSEMKIVHMDDKPMDSKHAQVMITEMGVRGFKFTTDLRLPINENVIWRFQMQLKEREFVVDAFFTSSEKYRNGYLYGAIWILGEHVRDNLMADVQVWTEETSASIHKASQNYALFVQPSFADGQVDLSC
jgi:hypothetical protein